MVGNRCPTPLWWALLYTCVCLYVPPSPLSLQCLTHMSVSGNHLESLPVEVGELRNLLELNLEGNELKRCAHHWEVWWVGEVRWVVWCGKVMCDE